MEYSLPHGATTFHVQRVRKTKKKTICITDIIDDNDNNNNNNGEKIKRVKSFPSHKGP